MQKIDKTGETVTMKSGLKATVIAYRNCSDIDIQFENGDIVKNRDYNAFKKGLIKCPSIITNNDISGQKFGMLTALEYIKGAKGKAAQWRCICDCGNERLVDTGYLLHGQAKSCGCFRFLPEKISTNKFVFKDDYIEMYSSNDKFLCVFDIDDYDKVNKYSWWAEQRGYLNAHSHTEGNKRITVNFARLVMNVKSDKLVDHKDGNPQNNRKNNLRICTSSQNLMNALLKPNKCGVKGVYFRENSNISKPYYSSITVNGEYIYLGSYKTKREAVSARQNAELKYFGEYSVLTRGSD